MIIRVSYGEDSACRERSHAEDVEPNERRGGGLVGAR